MNKDRIPDTSATYEIRINGSLDQKWSDWFDGFTFEHREGDTTLTGPVADQAALHGLLAKIRDLGLPILVVMRADLRKAVMLKNYRHQIPSETIKTENPLTKGVCAAAALSYLAVIGAVSGGAGSLSLVIEEHSTAILSAESIPPIEE